MSVAKPIAGSGGSSVVKAPTPSPSPPPDDFGAAGSVDAITRYKKAADSGDADAQHALSQAYDTGKGIPGNVIDAVKAFEYGLAAAKQNHIKAQCMVGYYYSKGVGVGMNYSEAMNWTERAAAQGSALANYNLAVRYERGTCGQTVNRDKALMYYKVSAALGYDLAKEALARIGSSFHLIVCSPPVVLVTHRQLI